MKQETEIILAILAYSLCSGSLGRFHMQKYIRCVHKIRTQKYLTRIRLYIVIALSTSFNQQTYFTLFAISILCRHLSVDRHYHFYLCGETLLSVTGR